MHIQSSRLSRRRFLRTAAAGAAGVLVAPILAHRPAWAAGGGSARPGKFLVVINMFGGNDSLNTVVPTGLAGYRTRRPGINLVDNLPPGQTLHDLDGGAHALHYSLDGVKQLWDEGSVHIVGNVSYPDPNQSHFTSREIYSYGVRDYRFAGDGRGWLGRFADCYWSSPVDPLGVISVGLDKLPDFRATTTDPLILRNVSSFAVTPDYAFQDDHELREDAVRDLCSLDTQPATEPGASIFRARGQTYPLIDRVQGDTAGWVNPGTYPSNSFGRRMRTISQLLHARSTWGTQVFYTGIDGFDTHSDQHSASGGENLHERLLISLDDALTAFANDMKARSLWNDCCIVIISEFGRNTYENGSNGTDHGHGGASLILGGSVLGGHTSPPTGQDLQDDVLPFDHDFRDIYGHLLTTHLGLDAVPLFPDPQYSPSFASLNLVS